MIHNIYLYIGVAAAVSFAIRVLPLTLIRREITSTYVKSFLYYVPYVTLAVMTFPAVTAATQSQTAGILAFAAGILAAWFGASMFQVALLCCGIVFLMENIILKII